MMIGISPETGNFVIRLSAPSQTDNFYLYEDSSIPSTSILTDLVNKNVLWQLLPTKEVDFFDNVQ